MLTLLTFLILFIMKNLLQFFQDNKGQLSSMRLYAYMIIIVALVCLCYDVAYVSHGLTFTNVNSAGILITLALTGKIVQKNQEEPVNTNPV